MIEHKWLTVDGDGRALQVEGPFVPASERDRLRAENERLRRERSYVYVVTRDYTWGGEPAREVVGVAVNDDAADRLAAEHRKALGVLDGVTNSYETTEYEVAGADLAPASDENNLTTDEEGTDAR